jgi:hypothetical protein
MDAVVLRDCIRAWKDLDDGAFAGEVEHLSEVLCQEQALAHLIRFIVNSGAKPLASDPERQSKLATLDREELPGKLRRGFERISSCLPPPLGLIRCHLLPAVGERGSGVCFAPDEIIVCVPVDGDASGWLLPTAIHEYSHTQRGFNEHAPVTIRDNLIFEGLAMLLPETIAPWPITWPQPPPEQEARFWETTDLEATSNDEEAHARYMQNEVAYAMGTRIVRSYLDRHRLSIVGAHRLSNEELYWNSGYPGLR